MKRALWTAAFFLVSAVSAQESIAPPKSPEPKLIKEVWQSASIDGQRSGYVHFTVHEIQSNGQKVLRAGRTLHLTLKRFGDTVKIQAETGTHELPDGRVVGVFMTQSLGKAVQLELNGVVRGQMLHTKAEGKMKFDREIPWNPAVLGTYGELKNVATLKPQPGSSFDYWIYEPIINSMVQVQAKAEAIEEVQIGDKKPYLLKVVAEPQPISTDQEPPAKTEEQPANKPQPEQPTFLTLPQSSFWFDANYELIRTETTMPGIGKLVIERTTREDALRPAVGPDLGLRQAIRLNQRLLGGHDAASATYRIKLKDANPTAVFAQDERQSVKPLPDGGIELTIKASAKAPADNSPNAGAPAPEYLTSNYFITSDDPEVRKHAETAIHGETDPLRRALLIESWVHRNMKVMNFTEAMAPASEVAKTLTGDCTEYSMLTAAMCRAVGVPSRTALGLVYVDGRQNMPPMLAMHMWTEIWVNGKWWGLDATLGQGKIGPGHIKVRDHSWHQVATMTPLLPLMRVTLSAPSVEIVQEQRSTP